MTSITFAYLITLTELHMCILLFIWMTRVPITIMYIYKLGDGQNTIGLANMYNLRGSDYVAILL